MSFIDIIILIILALFVWKGIKMGLIEAIGGIVGLFIGVFLAGRYYAQVAEVIEGVVFGSQILATILAFLLVFIVVNRGVALIFWIVDRIFHIVAIIPGLKSLNRLLGGIFALIEGLIFIGIIVYVLSFFPLTNKLSASVEKSKFAGIMETVGKISTPFIPDSLENWKDYVPSLPSIPEALGNIPLEVPDIFGRGGEGE